MRVLLWIVAIPVVLIALLAVLIPLFLDEKALVDLASEQIQEQTGAILRVEGDASFSLFPEVGIAASKVSVDVPDSKATIDAESLSVGVALMPLFSRTVDIKAIRVEGMTVTQQAANEDAAKAATLDTSTFSDAELDAYYAARDQARATAQAEAAASVLAVPLALEVGELALRDIRLITVDSEQQPISELQLKDFTATDMNIGGRPIPLNAHIVVPGEDAAPPIEVQLAGEVEAAINDNLISLTGLDIEITGATPDPVTVSMTGEFSLSDQVATLDIRLEIGEMTGEGSVRYASFESPQIDADLALTELNPALLVLAGPEAVETVAAAETEAPSGGETPLPLDAIRAIDTRAILSIDTVVVEPHVLTDVEATLRVVDGVVRLEPVSATVYEGEIDFQLVLDGRYNNANLETSGGVSNLSLAPAAAAMDVGVAASGEANLSFDLSGSGKTVEDLQVSMTGPIDFTTEQLTVEDVQVHKMLCQAVALVNQESLTREFPTSTEFKALEAKIRLADGVARLDPLTAALDAVELSDEEVEELAAQQLDGSAAVQTNAPQYAINISGNGELNLVSQDLRMSLRTQLGENFGTHDSACRINERIADLRWPVECSGNLAGDPASWCKVNTAEIIKDLAEGEVKRELKKQAGKLFKKLFN